MALAAIAGVGLGWWFRGGNFAGMTTVDTDAEPESNIERAGEVLSRLQDLATRMASDVGEHSSKVQEANDELAAGAGDSQAVVRAVAKLFDANHAMQEQLALAESRLQEQAQEIASYAAEARTDPMTGLPNRRALDAELGRNLAEFGRTGNPLCLTMVDVDHFKRFNDTYGHQAGDEVLIEVAQVLAHHASQHGMAARFGGEEFVLLLPGKTISEAESHIERLRQAIAALRFTFAGSEVGVTASLGIAQLLETDSDTNLIERADLALYAAKEAGRNRTWWHDGRSSHPLTRDPNVFPEESVPNRPSPESLPEPKPAASATADGDRSEDSFEDREEESTGDSCPPNRMQFCTLLRHRLAEFKRGGAAPSVILVRIDHLNRVGETHGQKSADLLTNLTAKYLAAATRDEDGVGSYDDNTFGVLLPGAGMANMIAIAERLRKTVAECKLSLDGREHRLTISIGGAEAAESDDTKSLLRRAEEALSASIKGGGNRGYFHNGNWSDTVTTALERLQSA